MPHLLLIFSQPDYLIQVFLGFFWYKSTYLMTNSVDSNQLASSEANWYGSTLFAKAGAGLMIGDCPIFSFFRQWLFSKHSKVSKSRAKSGLQRKVWRNYFTKQMIHTTSRKEFFVSFSNLQLQNCCLFPILQLILTNSLRKHAYSNSRKEFFVSFSNTTITKLLAFSNT